MHRILVYTKLARPGLHVWRAGTSIKLFLHPVRSPDGSGWVEFQCQLSSTVNHPVRFMLFSFNERGAPAEFESDAFQREFPRLPSGQFPTTVWCAAGCSRVVLKDPRQPLASVSSTNTSTDSAAPSGDSGESHHIHLEPPIALPTSLSALEGVQRTIRVHLISQSRFRPSELLLWDPVTDTNRRIGQTDVDELGPWFDVHLTAHDQPYFNFKFIGRDQQGNFTRYEPDSANRWYVPQDADEIWTLSAASTIAHSIPETHKLTLHYRQEFSGPARLHLWADKGDYETNVISSSDSDGWQSFECEVFTQLPYSCLFFNPGMADEWEHSEATRSGIEIDQDTEYWTLEGDHQLFTARPEPNLTLELQVANTQLSHLRDQLFAHVWVNRARGPITTKVPVSDSGSITLQVYADVTTSIKFYDEHSRWERFRHAIEIHSADSPMKRYVVLDRPPLLKLPPPADLVADPPFRIARPGAYSEGDQLHFVVHTPHAADVKVIGEWTEWLEHPVQMHSTHDGTYWWGTVKIADVLAGLEEPTSDYHGVKYQFLFNEAERLQDPAAGWVEESRTSAASRLVNHSRFDWQNQVWDRPSPDYYIIYQLHPSRFTSRFGSEKPLRRIAREIADSAGYLRDLGITAIQLLPINEVSSNNSWGYDPAYFYAVENDYCGPDGPDDLKHLVHTCHQHGLAVVLDVVFNHAGGDNILWAVARDSFFDGDTQWGALVNFDHPQCLHFFAQNLVYLANEFRIDAFRLDHTATIVHSSAWDAWSGSVRQLGSGGGWEFLHGVRRAVQSQVSGHCLLMAEHLPNEWSLTNFGGSMDAQWGDDFHDRLIDACRRQYGMSRLANALSLTHTVCDDWYKIVNYPESHDEVGNVRDRVAYVAGYGFGWRMSKVAAAATLLSRGIPLYFMGAESGEDKQFRFGSAETLDLDEYLANEDRGRIRLWWRELSRLRRDPSIQGPAPLQIRFAGQQLLAFSRGQAADYFIVLNFGGWSGPMSLAELNLPMGDYRELWNSTWPAFAIHAEAEDEHPNGGRDAKLNASGSLQIPDYGVVVLQRV